MQYRNALQNRQVKYMMNQRPQQLLSYILQDSIFF